MAPPPWACCSVAAFLPFLSAPGGWPVWWPGFVTMIALQLLALSCASTFTREQVAIGIAARMGNGMLITLLAWLLVAAEDPSLASAMGFTGGLSLVYAVAYVALARHPDDVLIGYKG